MATREGPRTRKRPSRSEAEAFETKLGFTFLETEQATEGVVVGVNSKRAGRFTIKKEVARQAFDLGKAGGAMQKGFQIWELIDAVVVRGDSVAKCTV